jgi:peptide/nickel transport system ATP-binding protein
MTMPELEDLVGVPALSVSDLEVRSARGPIVEGVSLQVRPRETVAVVGESGSGKSMTAKAISGLLPSGVMATGELSIGGQRLSLSSRDPGWKGVRGGRIALIPQDPFTSLSPRHRCGDQIAMPLGQLSKAERAAAVAAALDEVGLPARVARQYPFQLSGGMRQRVAIAAALVSRPQVVIADESTTALDVTTQREILDLLGRIQDERGTALILITHDLGVATGRADRVMVLYAGRVAEEGPCGDVLREPAHPYTARLLACDPPADVRLPRLPSIPGSVPQLALVGNACTFAARCDLATDECRTSAPALSTAPAAAGDRRVACFRSAEFRLAEASSPAAAPAATTVARSAGEEPAGDEPGSDPVLSVRDLTKTFGGHRALDAVNLTVAPGEAVAVVGESGSGKTTLARIVVGLESADAGAVTFRPRPGKDQARRAQIVFQDPYSALNPSRSVGSSLRDALRVGGRASSEVPELLEMVGLPAHYARRRPKALSGGERQRVAIARALAVRPELLVCDEPVSSLDVSVQAQILNLIADLRESLRLSVLFISHDLAVVRQVADRVYVLYQGRLVESGDAEDVLGSPSHDYTRLLLSSLPGASHKGTS